MEDVFGGGIDDRHVARGRGVDPFAINVQSAAKEITA